ncbi:MAG: hypothetical protein ACREMF_11790 [Gemmatimonadales bacterium]
MTTPQPPRASLQRTSFAIAMKDYPFIRPGIAAMLSAVTLVAACLIGVILIQSLRRASAIVELGTQTVFTLHSYNAALEVWRQMATEDDPKLERPEARERRDNIRSALIGQLTKLRESLGDPSDKELVESVLQGLASTEARQGTEAQQALIVVLSRQDAALFEAVAASQRGRPLRGRPTRPDGARRGPAGGAHGVAVHPLKARHHGPGSGLAGRPRLARIPPTSAERQSRERGGGTAGAEPAVDSPDATGP